MTDIAKVAFVGAECTGKTTMVEFITPMYDTLGTDEVGRNFSEEGWHPYSVKEMEEIVLTQERIEDFCVLRGQCKDFLFCDTCAITTEFYCYEYNGKSSEIIDNACRKIKDRYEIVFLLKNDFPWESDGVRRMEGDLQRLQQAMIKMQLSHYRIPYIEIGGTLDERVEQVKEHLDNYKFENYHKVETVVREEVN